MAFSARDVWYFVPRVLLSICVSAGITALLIRLTLASAETTLWPALVGALSNVSKRFVLVYLFVSLIRTALQARRYRLLLVASEKSVPSLFHILLVTLSRNMFVDMLPSRLGELSYLAMLKRGYQIRISSGVSSMVVCFVFDLIALSLLILMLISARAMGGGGQSWLLGVLISLIFLILVLSLFIFPVFAWINTILSRISSGESGLLAKGKQFLRDTQAALEETRRGKITLKILHLSLWIRLLKYFGLYCLFIGVIGEQFPDMTTKVTSVLPALISAEAGASLPVPTFMGFGTYETAGTLALVVLGANQATSVIVMLGMHVLSQIIDYFLGAVGLVAYIFTSGSGLKRVKVSRSKRSAVIVILVFALLGVTVSFLVYEIRGLSKRGAILPPDQGGPVKDSQGSTGGKLTGVDGFIVWSSNRSGNHDIYRYSMQNGKIKQLTKHPNTEYFPRISPDGRQIVFARAHEQWVSQRNLYSWDIWLLDLHSGKESILAKNGTVPTWSADGKRVYFLRNGNEVVEFHILKKREQVIAKPGEKTLLPPKTIIETPSMDSRGQRLAVTLRKTMRATALLGRDGERQKLGNGCQLTWGPGDRYLYKIDHGGKMQNALYKIDPKSLTAQKWFDSPGEYSHEYFPRVANTGDVLVYGASRGGHEHDTADYEIFLWVIGQPASRAMRITHHTGNDCWPDVYLNKPLKQ